MNKQPQPSKASPLGERSEPEYNLTGIEFERRRTANAVSDQPSGSGRTTDDLRDWPLNDKPAIFNGIRFGLTVEKWIIINKAHNAALAAEREKADNLFKVARKHCVENQQLKAELAAERDKTLRWCKHWNEVATAHGCENLTDAFVQLQTERQLREQAEQAVIDAMSLSNEMEAKSHQRLLSALAAIEKHNKRCGHYLGDHVWLIDDVDLSALKESRK